MTSLPIQRAVALLIAICFTVLPIAQNAHAAIIPTDAAIKLTERDRQIDRVNELLARDSVQSVMIGFGVDPEDASARVQSLTTEELQVLETRLGELPAGGTGVIEVVGIVAIVLIVLELLGVTNFFTSF